MVIISNYGNDVPVLFINLFVSLKKILHINEQRSSQYRQKLNTIWGSGTEKQEDIFV
jgi:hypothetical protein